MIKKVFRAAVFAILLSLVPWSITAQAPLFNSNINVGVPKIVWQVNSKTSDDELKMVKQMGIDAVELAFADNEMAYEVAAPIVARFRDFPEGGFKITLGSNNGLQKNTAIILGKSGRDAAIETFKNFVIVLGRLDIPVTAIAWQPNGIVRTPGLVNKFTRGGKS